MATLLSGKQSTYGSPYAFYTASVSTSSRTETTVKITFSISGHLQYSSSWLGTGYTLTAGIYVGGSWHNVTLKSSSSSWSGTTSHSTSTSFTVSGLSATTASLTGIQVRVLNSNGNAAQLNATSVSNISVGTYATAATPSVSSASVNFGSDVTISMSSTPSSNVYTLKYAFGSTSGTLLTKGSSPYVWTVPNSLMDQIPDAVSGTCTITCETYTSGGTLIGTKTATLTLNVPSSVVPTITSITTEEAVTNVAQKFGVYLKGQSQINTSIEAEGVYSSTIKSYKTTIDGITYSAKSFTSNVLKSLGTLTVSTTVTDSRGRTNTKSTTIDVLDYTIPTITAMSCYQCDAEGNRNGEGTYTKVIISGNVASVKVNDVEKNTKTLVLKYKATNDSDYTQLPDITPDSWSFAVEVLISGTDPNLTYEFVATLSDVYYEPSPSKSVTSAKIVISRLAGGTGVTLFEEAEEDGFVVAGNKDSLFTGNIYAEDAELELLYNQWISGGTLPDIPASDDPFILSLIYGGTGADNRKDAIANLSYLGENPIISIESDTVDSWKALGTGYCLITIEDLLNDQPATLGILQNYVIGNNVAQLWFTQPNGDMARRGGDSNGWDKTWRAAGSGSGGGGFVPNDYIIDSGVDGIWTWRKWNSGIAECWGQKSNSTPANTAQNIDAFPFPFTFAEPPSVNVGCTANGADYYRVHNLKNYTTTTTMRLTFINKYTSAAADITAEIYVQGLWKEFNPGTTLSQPVTPNIETKTLLWENPDPTSAFAAQTVNISNLQDYDMIIVRGRYSGGAYDSFSGFYKTTVGMTGAIAIAGAANGNRNFTIKSNAIQFDVGEIRSSYGGSASTNNGIAIPIAIYGLKTITAFNRSTDVDYYISTTEYTELELLLNNDDSTDMEPTLAMAYYNTVYPVGSILTSIDPNFDPNVQYEGQTWERFAKGRTLIGVDEDDEDFATAGLELGEKEHKLITDEMPLHDGHVEFGTGTWNGRYLNKENTASYGTKPRGWDNMGGEAFPASNDRGAGQPHNNIQPSTTVFFWKRTV